MLTFRSFGIREYVYDDSCRLGASYMAAVLDASFWSPNAPLDIYRPAIFIVACAPQFTRYLSRLAVLILLGCTKCTSSVNPVRHNAVVNTLIAIFTLGSFLN